MTILLELDLGGRTACPVRESANCDWDASMRKVVTIPPNSTSDDLITAPASSIEEFLPF